MKPIGPVFKIKPKERTKDADKLKKLNNKLQTRQKHNLLTL